MPEAVEAPSYVALYRQAFADYGTWALWNKRALDHPEPADALVIARALRIEGDLAALRLAEQIEQACRALASSRDSESYIAGATPLNLRGSRTRATSTSFMTAKSG